MLRSWMRDHSAGLIVFSTSFCLMLIELVSGRVMAPFLGVSVYAWTSVIGVILLGITFGNYMGGVLADRAPSSTRLGWLIAGAGFAILLTNYAAPLVGSLLTAADLPLPMRTVLFAFVAFFPAAFLLSTISPHMVKRELTVVDRAGSTAGTISAWSAMGSIVGTFAAGYVLISFLGTKWLITLTAIFLMGLGQVLATGVKFWKHRVTGVVAVFLIGDLLMPSVCQRETNYYCIRVDEKDDASGAAYTLRLDHLVHSFVRPQHPDRLGYAYEDVYTNLIASRHTETDTFRAFFIGGGGYVMPRYVSRFYPNAAVTVGEIDPGVTQVNMDTLGLPRDTTIRTVNRDARVALAMERGDQKYEFVFGDAFNDFSVPSHLTTVEFHRLLKSRMTLDGVYAMNIIDDVKYGHFLASMTRTLQSVWKYVYIAPQSDALLPGRNTIVLMATDRPIDRVAWANVVSPRDPSTTIDEQKHAQSIALLSDERVADFLKTHSAPALTDDFAPTDRYLAPVFRDAY